MLLFKYIPCDISEYSSCARKSESGCEPFQSFGYCQKVLGDLGEFQNLFFFEKWGVVFYHSLMSWKRPLLPGCTII
jgi:hypothetical protein